MIRVFLILILLSSCTSHLKLSSGGCKNTIFSNDVGDQSISFRSFSMGVTHEINLKDELLESDIRCENIQLKSVSVQKTWIDSTIGFFPFLSSRKLTVTY